MKILITVIITICLIITGLSILYIIGVIMRKLFNGNDDIPDYPFFTIVLGALAVVGGILIGMLFILVYSIAEQIVNI